MFIYVHYSVVSYFSTFHRTFHRLCKLYIWYANHLDSFFYLDLIYLDVSIVFVDLYLSADSPKLQLLNVKRHSSYFILHVMPVYSKSKIPGNTGYCFFEGLPC